MSELTNPMDCSQPNSEPITISHVGCALSIEQIYCCMMETSDETSKFELDPRFYGKRICKHRRGRRYRKRQRWFHLCANSLRGMPCGSRWRARLPQRAGTELHHGCQYFRHERNG